MSLAVEWYRSANAAPEVRPSAGRAIRNWVRSCLPEPDVRGKTIVLHSRRTFPKVTRTGLRSEFHGLFSEFHSVLGALAYGEAHGSVTVRVDFCNPLYVEPGRGPNWWSYFFDQALMRIDPDAAGDGEEVHLNRIVTKYGRYGGFSDLVQGSTAYLYPMTYGISRAGLHRLISTYVHVRPAIQAEAAQLLAARVESNAYVVGVHYRGTDATHAWTGRFNSYRTSPVSYRAYADEVRRVLEAAGPRAFQVFVATDEVTFLEFMQEEFGDRILHCEESPRVSPDAQAVHLDRTLPFSNYQKGKTAIVDCLALAATNYLVKGRSNLSDAALAFSPQLPYSFCPDVAVR